MSLIQRLCELGIAGRIGWRGNGLLEVSIGAGPDDVDDETEVSSAAGAMKWLRDAASRHRGVRPVTLPPTASADVALIEALRLGGHVGWLAWQPPGQFTAETGGTTLSAATWSALRDVLVREPGNRPVLS